MGQSSKEDFKDNQSQTCNLDARIGSEVLSPTCHHKDLSSQGQFAE